MRASVLQGAQDSVGEASTAAEVGGPDNRLIPVIGMYQSIPIIYDVQMVAGDRFGELGDFLGDGILSPICTHHMSDLDWFYERFIDIHSAVDFAF